MDIDTCLDAIRGIHHGMVREHQAEKERLELEAHDMRVLGYAQAIAFIRFGISWSHVHEFAKVMFIAEAEGALILLDGNKP